MKISNNVLAVFVGLGIIFSMIGLLMSITSYVSNSTVTGWPVSNVTSDSGTTSFSVKGNLILNLTDTTIDFGELEIDETKNSEDVSDWFGITNDGSVDFDVYAYGAASSDSPFTSTTGGADTLPNAYYQVHCNAAGSGTCNTTYRQVPSTASNKILLLDALDNEGGLDTATIGIQVTVPHDEQTGAKTADIVLYAEQN